MGNLSPYHPAGGPVLLLSLLIWSLACTRSGPDIRSLEGRWEIGESVDTLPPESFHSAIPVPGLADLAQPEFDSAGHRTAGRNYFWYRKVISPSGNSFEFARLKIHKAKFGHAVFVNGRFAGKYIYCFTPGYFEIGPYLNRDSASEILVRVGAHPGVLPDSIPYGYDVEKSLYYPGIYDRVELYTGSYPLIENIQIVPDIRNEKIGVSVRLENDTPGEKYRLRYRVSEKENGRVVAKGRTVKSRNAGAHADSLFLEIGLPGCRLWSPGDPFLYVLTLESAGDRREVTFGMREFSFDPVSKLALINNEPLYLRGTNVALHRFFEDRSREDLPWDRSWISGLHDLFSGMHWNSYRFHVGFAPEQWYETADEKGFLVQDEYPLWGAWSEEEKLRHRATVLAEEYRAWMRERWNHPSVVIWDAQNETVLEETGKAIGMVRHLDLSGRPWDNGFSAPQAPGDMIESHPYIIAHPNQGTFAIRPPWDSDSAAARPPLPEGGLLHNELSISPRPFNDAGNKDPSPGGTPYPNPTIINEYGWIWLYRNGSPAWAAEELWRHYPELDTPEKRWDWRGRVVAAMTEYWRSRREIAGVQHFCILTCDRPNEPKSQVSDEWSDVENLQLQPGFKKYVLPSFSPVGIMIGRWENRYPGGDTIRVPVSVINDLDRAWEGPVNLTLLREDELLHSQQKSIRVDELGSKEITFTLIIPEEPSEYEMIADLEMGGERIFSTRLFRTRDDL